MAEIVRMVCLANSRKRSDRCVAGKIRGEDGSLRWVRPVSARPEGGVSFQERRIDGQEPKLLDMIELSLLEPRPHDYQTENWLLDARRRWTRVGRAEWRHLARLADAPPALWLNGWSTRHGSNDRVPLEEAEQLSESLHLLRVDELTLRVYTPGSGYGDPTKRVQAVFQWSDVEYAMRVTDLDIEQDYLVRGNGRFQLRDCYLTVSLGEPFENYCYKLVAAIFIPDSEES